MLKGSPFCVIGGPPPPDHARRCHGLNRQRTRCKKWARIGSKYCMKHGGGRVGGVRRGTYMRVKLLPRFYSKELTDTLRDYVEESLGSAPHEQLNLFEELAIMRATTAETIKLFSAAQQSSDQETRVAAAVLVQDALKSVVSTCEAAARIEASGKDKISVHSVAHVVGQIVRIAYAVFGNEAEVKVFETQIREEVKIIGEKSGTDLRPDVDVTSMDSTIPLETELEPELVEVVTAGVIPQEQESEEDDDTHTSSEKA